MASRKPRGAQEKPHDRPLIAIVMNTSVSFDREIVAGAAQYAREVGDWQLYVEEEAEHRLPKLASWRGQGILASFDDDKLVGAILASKVPVVAVGGMACHDPASAIPSVATDHDAIANLAAEHFLERGLRHFGYYGAPVTRTTRWSEVRGAAFARRVAAAGCRCCRFTAEQGPEDWDGLQQALGAWLAALPKPAGVMACDDARGRHLLEACRRKGIRVPHEIAVIGVDSDELICELAVPPLTSIQQATRRIGYVAARLLDGMMRPQEGGTRADEARPVSTLVPPVGIVPRASTETLAVADHEIAVVIETIRERACGKLSVTDLAAIVGMPRWKLEKRFREIVGHSIHEDIVRVRCAEAQRLLKTTNLPLKAIAPRTGFRSVPYMITVFQRRFATTPAQFRKLEQHASVVACERSEEVHRHDAPVVNRIKVKELP
jgi:LacI family transcriptional regulator